MNEAQKSRPHNSTYLKVAVQWLNQALCFYQSLCWADSSVLRNRHLRVAANRYQQVEKSSTTNINIINIIEFNRSN
ncbi:MAG: hypothetical protein COZ16_00660 [Flavobacteriaceae bacterium CG_4_10_14_3_um_filter_31_253]|nr:MAG: hypothetical protein COW43_09545 [Flavobacteriaceae bacterium CG17_big_fil_post_rev_8_21_14_2_50_31_13]PIX13390.1 MAG: hypothetical protein COZ74_06560 [Flavobacteriaceae bacterium CG_4_8_14_3_um_filter_31_8]PIY16254.1 MAG: hypothetical protein COZ16_00660 [Flavobacteriaceae bacterium CG_4_10_14_3_um_filter_31_253]PIZ11730.1 MAG: hypothetical protein COY55_03470 [Flavobacteriaceae bacterium CG_4_10_14_0_8_um_filter_31_99]PJC09215.1 MAG: hypothetical protein CO067_10965 [Flavobacteriacea